MRRLPAQLDGQGISIVVIGLCLLRKLAGLAVLMNFSAALLGRLSWRHLNHCPAMQTLWQFSSARQGRNLTTLNCARNDSRCGSVLQCDVSKKDSLLYFSAFSLINTLLYLSFPQHCLHLCNLQHTQVKLNFNSEWLNSDLVCLCYIHFTLMGALPKQREHVISKYSGFITVSKEFNLIYKQLPPDAIIIDTSNAEKPLWQQIFFPSWEQNFWARAVDRHDTTMTEKLCSLTQWTLRCAGLSWKPNMLKVELFLAGLYHRNFT